MNLKLPILLLLSLCYSTAESRCSNSDGCDLALASYYVVPTATLSVIAEHFRSDILQSADTIVLYNRGSIPNKDFLPSFIRINIPFPCQCINGEFLGHTFQYNVESGDTYTTVVNDTYANLTTISSLRQFNSYPENNIPDTGVLNVTVGCSCGDSSISMDYGLFITYPLRPEDTLESIARQSNISSDLLRRYNDGANFSQGSGLVYIPGQVIFNCWLLASSAHSRVLFQELNRMLQYCSWGQTLFLYTDLP